MSVEWRFSSRSSRDARNFDSNPKRSPCGLEQSLNGILEKDQFAHFRKRHLLCSNVVFIVEGANYRGRVLTVMGLLSAVKSAWTARFINAAGPDLEPREDAFPCLRLIEHITTRTTGVREAAMLDFSQHCGTGYEKRWTDSSLHVGPTSSPAGRYSRSRGIVGRLSQTRRPSRQAFSTGASINSRIG